MSTDIDLKMHVYTPARLARALGISTSTLRRWRQHPKFPMPFVMGYPRWALADVQKWMRENCHD